MLLGVKVAFLVTPFCMPVMGRESLFAPLATVKLARESSLPLRVATEGMPGRMGVLERGGVGDVCVSMCPCVVWRWGKDLPKYSALTVAWEMASW